MLKAKTDVIKASPAIHIENKPNLLQRRAWNWLLANAYDELLNQDRHTIKVRELMEDLEYDSKNEKYLKDALSGLIDCKVEWNILGKDGEQEWEKNALLAGARIKNGVCTYAFSPLLRERLHNPRIYARISLSIENKFSSKHSIALYELFVDYSKVGETAFISLEKLRGLTGVKNRSYFQSFRHFNQKVIKPAIEEINKVSDLEVTTEYKRQGRGGKVVAVKFKIRRKPKKQLPKPKSDIKETLTGIAKELYDRGVNPKSAVQLEKNYPGERVQKVINLFDTGVIKVAGGIRRAIEDEWEPSEKQQGQVENVESLKEQEALEKQAQTIQMQRTVKALENFVSKGEWIASVIERSESARSVMIQQNLATSELGDEELEEIRQTAAKSYPESKEARLEYINRNKDDFGIDTNEIVKGLKQEKS